MRVQPLLMDMVKGQWAMSIEGLSMYAETAYRILSGQAIQIEQGEPKSILTILDKNGRPLTKNEDGMMEPEKGSVAIVDMIGPMVKYGDWCTYGANEIVNALSYADNNPNIIGTVANFDGPGGAVGAIGYFQEFAKTKKKPVVGLYDQCASAHLWAMSLICDYKMAANDISASIGSVGVMTSFRDNREYLEKLGFKFHDIYAPESEHKNQAFTLALEGKYDQIKTEMLSPLARKFQADVKASCPGLVEATGVLTGKMFFTDQALEYKMINAVGSMQRAIEMVYVLDEMKQLNKS